jgi:hypothetical protein
MKLRCGRYRHYKGGDYQVLAQVKHSETEQDMVLYKPLYGDIESRGLWVRPLQMFLELVEINGVSIARFEFIEPVGSPLSN